MAGRPKFLVVLERDVTAPLAASLQAETISALRVMPGGARVVTRLAQPDVANARVTTSCPVPVAIAEAITVSARAGKAGCAGRPVGRVSLRETLLAPGLKASYLKAVDGGAALLVSVRVSSPCFQSQTTDGRRVSQLNRLTIV